MAILRSRSRLGNRPIFKRKRNRKLCLRNPACISVVRLERRGFFNPKDAPAFVHWLHLSKQTRSTVEKASDRIPYSQLSVLLLICHHIPVCTRPKSDKDHKVQDESLLLSPRDKGPILFLVCVFLHRPRYRKLYNGGAMKSLYNCHRVVLCVFLEAVCP